MGSEGGGGAARPPWQDGAATAGQNVTRKALYDQIKAAPTTSTGSATITVGAANAGFTLTGTQISNTSPLVTVRGGDVVTPYYQRLQQITFNDASRGGSGGGRRNFKYTGRYLEIAALGRGAVNSKLAIWADNVLLGYTVDIPSDGAGYVHKVDFGSTAPAGREIIIVEQGSADYGGLKLETGSTLSATATPSGLKVCAPGDSFVEGTGATYGALTSFLQKAQNSLGLRSLVHSGEGGTGYIQDRTSGNNPNLQYRLTPDVLNGSPDVVTLFMGINDETVVGGGADLQGVVSTMCGNIRTSRPNALIYAIGPWNPSAPTLNGNRLSVRNQIRDACAGKAGVYFIDPTGVSYTKVGGGDLTHPDQPGHDTLGSWLDGVIRANVGA